MGSCSKSAEDYLKRGNELAAEGKHEEAVLNYRKAIQEKSTHGEAHYRLGLSLVRDKKFSEAVEALSSAVRMDANHTEAKVELAKLNLEIYTNDPKRPKRLYDELKRLSGELVAKDPNSAQGLRFQGELALLDKNTGEALDLFRKAVRNKDAPPEAARGLVRSLLATNQYPEAEKEALALIEKDKTYGFIYDDLYALYMITKRTQDAERIFQTKVANNPASEVYRLQLAAHFVNNKKQAEMEAALQPLSKDRKTFPDGAIEVGRFYARLSMWEKAKAVYEDEIRANSPNKLKAKKLLLQTLTAMGKSDEANRVADEVVKEFPDDTEGRYLRASFWVDSKDDTKMKAAIGELEGIRDKRKSDPMFFYVLGQAHRRTGDEKSAEAAYRDSVKVSPGFKLGYVTLAEVNLEKGQPKAALDWIGRAALVDANDPQVRLLRGRALLESGNTGEGRAVLASLASAYPGTVEAQLQYAMALIAEEKYDQAELIFRKFYRPGMNDQRLLEGLIRTNLARGRTKQAYDLLEAELRLNANSKEARQMLAQVALADRKPAVAVQQYTELIKAEPNSAVLHYQLGQALRMKGDAAAGLANLEKAEQLDPSNPAPMSVVAFLMQEAGRHDEAEKRWRRIMQLRPDDTNVMNNLAYLLAESGKNLEEAQALAQKAVQKAPSAYQYIDTLGWVYLKKKEAANAVQSFRAVVQKAPENPLFLLHLGLALTEAGQKQEARSVLENALRKKPNKADEARIQEALKRLA